MVLKIEAFDHLKQEPTKLYLPMKSIAELFQTLDR